MIWRWENYFAEINPFGYAIAGDVQHHLDLDKV